MEIIALKATLAYFICYGGNWLFGTNMAERPIVVGAVTGLLLGDLKLGLMMGATLEAVFMGSVNIGGQISAEPASATVFAVTFASQQAIDANAALTLAIPIGILSGFVSMFINNIFLTVLVPIIDKYAAEGNERGLNVYLNFGVWLGKYIVFCSVVFFGIMAGQSAVSVLVNSIPPVVMTGLSVAGKFLPAVGLAILMKMLWSKEIAVYYFLGFILFTYFELPLIAVAALGIIIVVCIAYRDLQLKSLQKANTSNNNLLSDEEDFLS